MVLAYFGIEKSEQSIRILLKTKPAGTNLITLANLRNWDIDTILSSSNLDELQNHLLEKHPTITLLWTGVLSYWDSNKYFDYLHAVVVVGYDKENILINDPAFSEYPKSIPINEFLEAWSYSQQMLILIQKP
ncbi:MAG: cysteine peptidase family C39 domain-containing protein [bacterium]|nr:cysteine peptidase family C39 domain-containing protein [bacterium]